MKEELFKLKLKKSSEISLVGPLFSQEHLTLSTPIIFIDGGLHFRKKIDQNENFYNISIGDGDSLEEFQEAKDQIDLIYGKDKNETDFKLALSLIPEHINKIFFYGLTGGRLDHQLAILGELHHFLKGRGTITECYLDNHVLASNKEITFEKYGTFSVMSLEENVIQLTGECLYKMEKEEKLRPFSGRGISNQANGQVTIKGNLPFFIIFKVS